MENHRGSERPRIAVAKLKHTVDWETMDSTDVKLVILFAVKDADSGAGHIRVLAKISMLLVMMTLSKNYLMLIHKRNYTV
ncbi:PTS system 2-O-a-mannosyl-D-glycerate specific transporter subunit IIABC [Raoultella terrigena]|uniref:PTS system 2-O-a-mannosyl-D-glycerate specific transporter subunit IIABC n=1 Tax=Raoultella terrigena TaxID=577 RepID=A0A4U9CSF1_RAOTE|nr:PTS system 2-O-a-mannosyl-D-glycerate specific transporter subunit IIABC [Raoultella terrigena]